VPQTFIEAHMSGISDIEVMNALRRQMTLAAARQAASAGNLANVDTPGYKAVDVSFSDTLDAQLTATNKMHIGSTMTPGMQTEEIVDAAQRRDGNTVVLDQELLKMSRAAGDFSAAQTALAAKFRLVRYAINEGR
jgi:flagellar basal-body rod protein FlgB